MLSSQNSNQDPLKAALAHKARTGAPGACEGLVLAAGEGWRVVDLVCTSGPEDRAFEERFGRASISLVLSGTFAYRSDQRWSLISSGALLLGNPGSGYEVSHQHGAGDRCLSFQFAPEVFERVAYDAGARRGRLDRDRLPPLRTLAPYLARAGAALGRDDSFEEIAFALAGAVIPLTNEVQGKVPAATASDRDRIGRVLNTLQSGYMEAHSVAELARIADLSPYHFLRTFTRVTGVTPHQWLLRARLRAAAHRLLTGPQPITEIALDVGFDDLSNFIRSFRAEFGVTPSRYRFGVSQALSKR